MDALTDRTTVLRHGPVMLRDWQEREIPQVFDACQDPQIQRWTSVPSPYLLTDAEDFVRTSRERWALGHAPFAMTDPPGDRVLGSIGLVAPPHDGVVEVGFWVAPWARRRGVAAAATAAVCDWVFDVLGMHRVDWQAEVGNDASRAVATKCGFTFEGTLRQRGLTKTGHADMWIAGLVSTDPRPWRAG